MKKLLMLGACVLLSAVSLKAQDFSDPKFAKYGETAEQREHNIKILNFFNDAYMTKAYDEALLYMHEIIAGAPQASLNVYIKGGDIYRIKMARSRSKDDRNAYLDSMLYLLDKRIEFFGDHAKYGETYLHGQKALIYNENNKTDREKCTELFKKAIEVGQHNVDPQLCVVFFNSLTESYGLNDITPEEYIADFGLINEALEAGDITAEDKEAIDVIATMFAGSGAASCENLEAIYKPQYEANPDDAELVKKILSMFNRSKCSSDFQTDLTVKYYNIDPTAELATMLGGIYEEKGEYELALKYFQEAADKTEDSEQKIGVLIRAANAANSARKYKEAADFSKQVIAIDESNPYAYLFLAGAYAGGAGNCSGFEAQAAYWLVVDAYVKARNMFEGDEEQVSNINKIIYSYSANFPNVEDTFMRGLSPGQSYTVRCGWLVGSTTVRENK